MENISVARNDFNKILATVEILINDVEQALSQNEIAEKRMNDVISGNVAGRSQKDYNEYLKRKKHFPTQ